jgi:hypothetical protein
MSEPKQIFELLLRGPPEADRLQLAVARAFGLPGKDVRPLDRPEAREAAVVIEVHDLLRGFRTHLALYLLPSKLPRRDLTELDIAKRLSSALNQDALLSSGDSANPFLWLLVKPDGSVWRARQRQPAEDDVVEIREEILERASP